MLEIIISSQVVLAGVFGLSVKDLYTYLFLGNHGGCIGETGTLLILFGGIYLIWRGVIDWKIPFFIIVTVIGITWAGGVDPILSLTTEGLCFGAFFMATDYVTSPVTGKSRWVVGLLQHCFAFFLLCLNVLCLAF